MPQPSAPPGFSARQDQMFPTLPGEDIERLRDVTPSALESLKTGSIWVHVRLCRTCGQVGCSENSPNRDATKHCHASGLPIIEGYRPPEGWARLNLRDRVTPQRGPIPRYY